MFLGDILIDKDDQKLLPFPSILGHIYIENIQQVVIWYVKNTLYNTMSMMDIHYFIYHHM